MPNTKKVTVDQLSAVVTGMAEKNDSRFMKKEDAQAGGLELSSGTKDLEDGESLEHGKLYAWCPLGRDAHKVYLGVNGFPFLLDAVLFKISVRSSDGEKGSVRLWIRKSDSSARIAGSESALEAEYGKYYEIKAEALDGASFIGWVENGDIITNKSIKTNKIVRSHDFAAYFINSADMENGAYKQVIYCADADVSEGESGTVVNSVDKADPVATWYIPSADDISTALIPADRPSKKGYVFNGWNTGIYREEDGIYYVAPTFHELAYDITVIADASMGNAFFSDIMGNPVGSEMTVSYGNEELFYLNARPLEGYYFDGWYDENGCMVSADGFFSIYAVKDMALTARFSASEITGIRRTPYIYAYLDKATKQGETSKFYFITRVMTTENLKRMGSIRLGIEDARQEYTLEEFIGLSGTKSGYASHATAQKDYKYTATSDKDEMKVFAVAVAEYYITLNEYMGMEESRQLYHHENSILALYNALIDAGTGLYVYDGRKFQSAAAERAEALEQGAGEAYYIVYTYYGSTVASLAVNWLSDD